MAQVYTSRAWERGYYSTNEEPRMTVLQDTCDRKMGLSLRVVLWVSLHITVYAAAGERSIDIDTLSQCMSVQIGFSSN